MTSSYLFPRYRLLVMSKSPMLGRVKTRMQPQLTPEESVQLHTTLTQYCLQQWASLALCPLNLWVGGCLPTFRHKILSPLDLALTKKMVLQQQPEGDLGERMSFAATTACNDGVDGVILLGTDCPFIDHQYLQSALQCLSDGRDIVIGPANDGGYVLLAMKRHCAELFTDVAWGTETVFASTMQKIQEQHLDCYVLPPLNDVDSYDDLAALSTLPPLTSDNEYIIHFSTYSYD